MTVTQHMPSLGFRCSHQRKSKNRSKELTTSKTKSRQATARLPACSSESPSPGQAAGVTSGAALGGHSG